MPSVNPPPPPDWHTLALQGRSDRDVGPNVGDGPGGAALDPPPTAIAPASQMMGDAYLFYRISEGGAFAPFNSAMPSWKTALEEEERWDVINYVRALGSGQIEPGRRMGGMMFDPEVEALKHEKMTKEGVELGIITQEQADTFIEVHALLDTLMYGEIDRQGSMDAFLLCVHLWLCPRGSFHGGISHRG